MSAPSPAQQRVVDAMRDGAELIQSDVFSPPDWSLVLPDGTHRRLHPNTGWALVSNGVVSEGEPRGRMSRTFVFTPAYQDGEE